MCIKNLFFYYNRLEIGSDPDAQDSFGNTILHMVVVNDKLEMFGYALRFLLFYYIAIFNNKELHSSLHKSKNQEK